MRLLKAYFVLLLDYFRPVVPVYDLSNYWFWTYT
jgi:hypothetical protein